MRTLYTHVNLLDGTEEMECRENTCVLVDDERIISIGEKVPADRIVDLKGSYMIPGLINLHVHTPGNGESRKSTRGGKKSPLSKLILNPVVKTIFGRSVARSTMKNTLMSGTTTVRAVGGLVHSDSWLRDQIRAGKAVGPRMQVCDTALTVPKGHMEGTVSVGLGSKEEFEAYIEENVRHNVDWIKIMITGGVLDATVKGEPGDMKMTAEQVKICCDKAHSMGKKVCAHVESPKGIQVAVEAGVDSIEHGSILSDELAETMKAENRVLVCTLSPAIPLCYFDPKLTMADEVVQFNAKALLRNMIAGVKTARDHGVTVGLGTDAACPYITHYDMWRELEYYHRLIGGSRKEALHLATQVNAQILGLATETGSLEAGKSADFMVVSRNPLEGFDALAQPEMVVFRGKEYNHPEIKKVPEFEHELDRVWDILEEGHVLF